MPPAPAPLFLLQQEDGSWQRLVEPVGLIAAHQPGDVLPALAELEAATRSGLHAAGFIAYDAASAFDPHLICHRAPRRPLLWFQLGHRLEPFLFDLPAAPELRWTPEMPEARYRDAVRRIHEWIAAGDTYQVNLTYRLFAADTQAAAYPWLALPLSQPRGVGAYFATPDFVLASASPELFFSSRNGQLICRPMKGTAPRGRWPAEDRENGAKLQQSAKNRAENLMITDMVRNDLGRVARPGSVQVRDLFTVERYPTVWQMTSTIEGHSTAALPELMTALFPSASVTGAPKVRTMQIIRELETSPRGVYTGAVGWVGPVGQARFNVAIRTVWLDRASGRAEYGTGSGVVWDSDAATEYSECRDKTRVLGWKRPGFELLETLVWRPGTGFEMRAGHLDRLAGSAGYFDYAFDRLSVERSLETAATAWTEPQRVRLLLSEDGTTRIETHPLPHPPASPARVRWAQMPISTDEVMLYHKTTDRRLYEAARAACPDADDVLLWNERGELAEATIANVAVKQDGVWWTPPIACGLLPGVMRGHLLTAALVRERVIRREEIGPDSELALFNSVRGWWPAKLAD